MTQNERMMKRYSLLAGITAMAVTFASSLAQDKATLEANASVAGILQGSVGKAVELHLRSGEKIEAKLPK
jgi:hypothetical protein